MKATIESLETRRLLAAATVMVTTNPADGFLEITGTRRHGEITVSSVNCNESSQRQTDRWLLA